MKRPPGLIAAIVVLTACGIDDREPLWLAVGVDKTIVAIDDSVRVTVVVNNSSDRDVMTYAADAYGRCLPGFQVTDEQGRGVLMLVTCTADLPARVALAPGETLEITSWWHPGISVVGSTPISPGIYSLRGAIASDDDIVRSGAFEILVTPD